MLEVKNLVKVYKPKKGVPVRALDGVSLKFPETGMVFLLGKSGSGKSTLLNVLGGLDRYNEGEILIKGKSSRTFRQSHFDSYRNTYVGFIFQEYNILEEFSVGANIGLALQLQGIKPTQEQINAILREVDLEGYGNRKPNELSGGQKQRVAIARALVKIPQIIMADEPTGALDSATGKQVLSTLKRLSRNKLVIVVSHDREFAEQYGDRIIELADGKVIRDVERVADEYAPEQEMPVFEEDTVFLPEEYILTEEDRQAICDYIQEMVSEKKTPQFQLFGQQGRQSFRPTDESQIRTSQEGYKLIKSRLPLKFAFKLGASGLKHKKFRLVMTIILSCIAFVLFGLVDTFASYDYVTTSVRSLTDPESQVFYAALEKQSKFQYGEGEDDFYWQYGVLTDEDYAHIEEQTGIKMYPVYARSAPDGYWNMSPNLEFSRNIGREDGMYYSSFYSTSFGGYVEVDEELLEELGAELVEGRLPAPGTDELAISQHILEVFKEYGYCEDRHDSEMSEAVKIKNAKDMIGKTLILDGITYTVTGVVDSGIDYSRYDILKEEVTEDAQMTDMVLRMVLETEMRYSLNYSLTGLAMVSEGQFEKIAASVASNYGGMPFRLYSDGYDFGMYYSGFGTLTRSDAQKVVWLDGQERTNLAENEIVLTEDAYMNAIHSWEYREALDFRTITEQGGGNYSAILNLRLELFQESNVIVMGPDGEISSQGESFQNLQIVGIIPGGEGSCSHFFSQEVVGSLQGETGPVICQTIAAMPEGQSDIQKLVKLTDEIFEIDGEEVCYQLCNPVSFELKNLDEVFEVLSQVFFWIGVVFVVFASLLFSNFIATSISYKKQEIGILRAIGSRSNDVFRIFFAESFIIAMINFVLSLTGTIVISAVINYVIRNNVGLLLTVLNVGIRQGLLLFGICLLLAAVASFLPVRKIAAKRPIDAIRDR